MNFIRLPLAVLALSVCVVCRADSSGPPQWIWGSRDASRFELTRSFSLPDSLKTCQLKCAVDFCRATLWLNDRVACEFDGSTNLQLIDVLHFLTPGTNRIRVSAQKIDGPAAIAFELEVVTQHGRQQLLRSHHVPSDDQISPAELQSFGDVTSEPWWHITRRPNVSVFDEYNQWMETKGGTAEEELASFQLHDGFQIELVYTARPGQGSWVSMVVDDQDRLLLGREDIGIDRLTFSDEGSSPKLERLNTTLRGVQGLLLTREGLIASANRSRGLFRLSGDSHGDPFGQVALLQETHGNQGDHGRHDVVQDSDGNIYVIHGDSVQIPDGSTSLVPATHEFIDGKPEDGHVIRTDVEGKAWTVFCSGLRNPYGLVMNDVGEFFTYDADAERHTGLPWYRPTRIVHLMPGVDYGWRNPGIPWPGYLPDTVPPIVKIGRGSPTSLKFGYASAFPPAFRGVLFALDWSYGRILAIHLVPQGSTYAAHAEVFVRGRPFSVCDLDFARDGSMYIVTGGRETQSRLYRIRYVGPEKTEAFTSRQVVDRLAYSHKRREDRRQLESYFDRQGTTIVDRAWNDLSHPDRGIRSAARILLEHQPASGWQDRVWSETQPAIALQALLALVRTGDPSVFPKIHQKLLSLPLDDTIELQTAIRIESLIDKRLPRDRQRSRSICNHFDHRYPTGRRSIDRELCRLLVEHRSDRVVERTLRILADETNQIDQFHYLICLADAVSGWNAKRHDQFFRVLTGAKLFLTDEGLNDRVHELFGTALTNVDESRHAEYRELFASDTDVEGLEGNSLPLINRWNVATIMNRLEGLEYTTNAKQGAQIFKLVRCDRCHRFGTTGRPFGPDLTTVASRFSREHILEQIVKPSKVISSQYRSYVISLKNGATVNGQVVYNGFRKSILRVATDPMSLHDTTEIRKQDIEWVHESPVSPMPERLLDSLTIEQIADLLAYLETGTN